jgi:hypothetical protein
MIAAGNKGEAFRFQGENHAQMKTCAALHDGASKFSDACAVVCVRSADGGLCCLESFNYFRLLRWGKRSDPLAEAGR